MSLFKRKRSLTPEEYANQQALLRRSAEKGVQSLNTLCAKLDILLHDADDETAADPNDSAREPPAGEDVYHQFLNSPDALSTTRHHDNLSTNKRSHARINKFLNEARNEMGVSIKTSNLVNKLKFRKEHQRAHGSEECFLDGRYLVWLCGVIFEQSMDGEGMEDQAMRLLDSWQESIGDLLTGDAEDKIMWRLLLQKLELSPSILLDATKRHLNNQRGHRMGIYFTWPSFLRSVVLNKPEDEKNMRSNKRRKSNDGSAFSLQPQYKPISFLEMKDPEIQQERNGWLPLLGYVSTHAYLSRDAAGATTIHETMDYLQNVLMPTLPATLGFDSDKRKALLSGTAAYLIDALGDSLAVASSRLGNEEEDAIHQQQVSGVGSILGAEVDQIVDMLCLHSLMPTLAKFIDCPLAGLVSETAGTLLDYSDIYHRLHHEASPMAEDDVIQQLMAKDALKVMYFIDKANPQLRKELSAKNFTKQTFDDAEGDPRKHPIVTFLQAHLVTSNLDEGAILCRALEDCSGLDKETERCCWYLLFDKMQEENVLLEHHWEINRGLFHEVPVIDFSGKVSIRRIGNITLANIQIGPFGRMVALEYLNEILAVAKDEMFTGNISSSSPSAFKTKRKTKIDQQYFVALKDAIRRTVLRFLLPRPHSPDEAFSIANRVSEAAKPPLLKHHAGAPRGQDAGVLCCRILQQPSLMEIWEKEKEKLTAAQQAETTVAEPTLAVEEETEARIEESQVAHPTVMSQEESVEDDGVCDMSMELIPPTPAKTQQKPPPAFKSALSEEEDVIELGDSDDEEVVAEDDDNEDLQAEIDMEESGDDVDEADESATKSFEDSPNTNELESEEAEGEYGEYESNEEYPREKETAINYPPHYHQYAGNYSESDDYEEEDEEEANRRLAFEGQYDAEEGRGTRGNSSSGGSVEVYDIGSSSEEENEEELEGIAQAEDARELSIEEGLSETAELNKVVNEYIGSAPKTPETEYSLEANDGKILHDNVHEYIPVSSPLKKNPENFTKSDRLAAVDVAVAEGMPPKTDPKEKAVPSDDEAVIAADEARDESASIDVDVNLVPTSKEHHTDEAEDAVEATQTKEAKKQEETATLSTMPDEAYNSDAPYSSDGGNLGGELSEDMNADDEHESLDTEDDKRSLLSNPEHGETFDEEEAGPLFPVHSDANEDYGNSMEIDQPSILVAAAMSSQHQASSYPMIMTKSYRLKSADNSDVTAAAPDEKAAIEHNVQHAASNEQIDLLDSDVEMQEGEGGQLTDDGYVPDADAEATEEERIEKKKIGRSVDDGYIPDAEATEEETSKPVIKKRDVRFEPVIETREVPQIPLHHVEPAANQSIDDGYLPDGALTEEEKRERQERGSRSIEEGYLPDGHTTATDDDTMERKERRFPHRNVPPTEADAIDPGYLPSAVEGTEEERSEEESQKTFASVLVATALVTQKGTGVSDIASKASLATARIAKPKSISTQSIDDGYIPEGTFDEEERGRLRKETRSQYVEEGYLPDGHTTPGDATEEEQPDVKPKMLLEDSKTKLSESVAVADVALPATTLSIDDGYLPSAVEEERSEEDTLTDTKNNAHHHDGNHDTEDDSLAIASSADILERHSESVIAAANKSKDVDGIAPKNELLDDAQQLPTADQHTLPSIRTNANRPEIEDSLLQPITDNPLKLIADSYEMESGSNETTKPIVKNDESPKPARSSRRKSKTQSGIQPQSDVKSVQSASSSVRRSSRIKTRAAASPKVPSSIATGSHRGKAPMLPAVPEDDKLEEPVPEEVEKIAPSIAIETRRGGNPRDTEGDVPYSSNIHEEVSITSRTRRRGKKAADVHNDDDSHVGANEETMKITKSKRAKSGTQNKQTEKKGDGKKKSSKPTIEAISSPPSSKTRSGRVKKNADGLEAKDDASKTTAASSTKGRTRRAKKKETQDNISELSMSPPAKTTRRGITKKGEDPKDTVSDVASPPKTRRGRGKNRDTEKDEETISSAPTTRSSRRTRQTAPSEASESIASSRPRRNVRASKKFDL